MWGRGNYTNYGNIYITDVFNMYLHMYIYIYMQYKFFLLFIIVKWLKKNNLEKALYLSPSLDMAIIDSVEKYFKLNIKNS